MKLLVIGWHGKHNIGDDIMLDVIAWYARRHWQMEELLVWASDEELAVQTKETPIKGILVKNRIINYFKKIHAVITSDMLLFGGGSIFHSVSSCRWKYFYTMLFKVFNHKKRVISIGVSIGPFRNEKEKEWGKRLLKKFDYIAVRDRRSFEFAKELGLDKVKQGFDIAILFNKVYGEIKKDNTVQKPGSTIGFAIANFDRFKGKGITFDLERTKKIGAIINKLKAESPDTKVKLFALCSDSVVGDVEVVNEIKGQLNDLNNVESIIYSDNISEVIAEMGSCATLISMRLHGAVLAYSLGIPFIMLDYHDKCYEFAKYIDFKKDLLFDSNEFEEGSFLAAIKEITQNSGSFWGMSVEKAQELALVSFKDFKIEMKRTPE